MSLRRVSAVAALSWMLLLVGVTVSSSAHAADAVRMNATVDGRPIAASTERHPLRLHPTGLMTLRVDVDNQSAQTIKVRTIRLEGRAVGLSFFAYDTGVGLDVPAGSTDHTSYQLDLSGLKGQAVGLMPGSVKLLDANRHVIASQSMVTDVRGSLFSVYGLFGIAIAVLTVFLLVRAVIDVARGRTSPNRWWRGVRFMIPGIGVGLVAVFTLSATRLFAPKPDRWLPIVLIAGGVGFLLGYLTPTPDTELIDLTEPEADDSESDSDGDLPNDERVGVLP